MSVKQILLECNARDDGPELIHPRCMRNRLPEIFWFPRKSQRLRTVERHREANFPRATRMGALECCLLRRLGFRLCCRGLLLGCGRGLSARQQQERSATRTTLYCLFLRTLRTLRRICGGHAQVENLASSRVSCARFPGATDSIRNQQGERSAYIVITKPHSQSSHFLLQEPLNKVLKPRRSSPEVGNNRGVMKRSPGF